MYFFQGKVNNQSLKTSRVKTNDKICSCGRLDSNGLPEVQQIFMQYSLTPKGQI